MNKDLQNKDINIRGLLDLDNTAADMASWLIVKISEAKSKGLYEDSLVSNYNTYDFSFNDDLITISGLVKKDSIFKLRLSEFINELKKISDSHALN